MKDHSFNAFNAGLPGIRRWGLLALLVFSLPGAASAGASRGWFRPAGTVTIAEEPLAGAAGDFNGDGATDLAVALGTSHRVAILLGDGKGGFTPGARVSVARRPISLLSGDLTGDGIADLVVASLFGNRVTLLRGAGGGAFTEAAVFPVTAAPRALVRLASPSPGTFRVAWVNIRGEVVVSDGFEGEGMHREAGDLPTDLAVGDFDGDGREDLAVTSFNDGALRLFLAAGDGSFAPPRRFEAGRRPVAVCPGDFDGDGHLDAVVADTGSNFEGFDGALLLFAGQGDGTFSPPIEILRGGVFLALACGDLDGDRIDDLVAATHPTEALTRTDLLLFSGGRGGALSPLQRLRSGDETRAILITEFTGDGRPDLVGFNAVSNTLSLFRNRLR